MTVSDYHRDDEYVELFRQLIQHGAESTRLDAEELRESGFIPTIEDEKEVGQ